VLDQGNGFLMSIINKLIIKITSTLVGTDEFNNTYYLSKKNHDALGRKRRYVIYHSNVDISNIPPNWHAWLHYMIDNVEEGFMHQHWMIKYTHNQTGNKEVYKPININTNNYKTWQPNN